ncbi:MAG: HupE/UreJ family protein [Candidatus Hydrogenedentota bacterium]
MRHLDHWGKTDTYPHYHAGWAMAGNTPFPYFKQSSHRGGQADALIVHWPNGIKAKGEVRNQYHHISDIAPSIMQAAGIEMPETYHGIPQQPFTGIPFNYAFDNADAPNAKKVQYYEMFGNRAIWNEGWKAVTLHGNRMPWIVNSTSAFEDDVWELYNVAQEIIRLEHGHTSLTERLPWLVSFSFGLLHGFGFAGALTEIGLPQTAIPFALLFFNIGVEAGQLLFVLAVLGILHTAKRFWTAPSPVWATQLPAYLIGTVVADWTIERLLAL